MNLIGGFWGNESKFGRLMTRLGTIIAINILFVISCVPFVTVGAAAVAMYYTIFEMLDAETPINPFKLYWKGLRKRFVPATISWLIFVVIAGVGFINVQICAQWEGAGRYLSAGVIAVLIVACVVIVYLLPVLAMFSDKLRELVKLSVCAAMSRPLRAILVLLLHLIPILVMYLDEVNRPTYAFIGAFFGFGLIAYVVAKIVLPQFEAYYEMVELN